MHSLITLGCIIACIISLAVCQECPDGYDLHPVLLISMDGFRYDYLTRGLNPHIDSFRAEGVTAPYMIASYPTITFPNHYTIVTGLYPESHGIVGNIFYDPSVDLEFNYGDTISTNGSWWGGDPLWNTVQKQGLISATEFWPGSDADIEGMYPNFYLPYDGSVSYEERVDKVLSWLQLPAGERPDFITLYFDEPDHTGHSFGPDSSNMTEMLKYMDDIFDRLIVGIDDLGLHDCVNIILLADHGMTNAGPPGVINLADYDSDIEDYREHMETGPFGMVYVNDANDINSMRNDLACQQPEFRQYSPESMPTRTHFSNNVRIGDVLLDVNEGYTVEVGEPGETGETIWNLLGQHGYDPLFTIMQPFFMARGPEFLEQTIIEPFQNIEIYDLMCALLGVQPSPNNGTVGSLYHTLKNPPPYPSNPSGETPPAASIPDESTTQSRLSISACSGDYSTTPDWVDTLNMTEAEIEAVEELHFPWGVPLSGSLPADLILLHQTEHVTGFSNFLKMPLWTSFTISEHTSGSSATQWSSDVRLDSSNTPTCQSYADVASQDIFMEPLFPSRYSVDNSQRDIPYLVSNAVPMTSESVTHFTDLNYNFIPNWLDKSESPLNIIFGPVFDNNFDSLVDDFTLFNITDVPSIPSHMFIVVTRCLDNVTSLNTCSPTSLDVMAFILPQRNFIRNCLSAEQFALEFSAKVKDVEIITGLSFYPDLNYEDRVRLEIRIHSQLWLS